MLNRWFHAPRIHTPEHGAARKVIWLELFYDLIYVAAIIQLGTSLSQNVGLTGALTFAGLFVPIWYTWTGFTFYNNRFIVDDSIHRVLVFLQMFAIGAVAVSVPEVFSGEHFHFAIAYGVARLALVGMYARAMRHTPEARETGRVFVVGFSIGAALWLLSAFLPSPWSFLLWVVAMMVDLAVPLTSKAREETSKHPIDILHLSERYGLLTIIVLGESFVKVLTDVADRGGTPQTMLMAALGLAITCSLWWIYFDDVAGSRIKRKTLAPYIWLYAHLPMGIAITAVGVAIKKVVFLDAMAIAPDKYRWLLCGALAMALLSVGIIDAVTERRQAELSDRARVNMRLASAVVVLVTALIGAAVDAWVFVLMVTLGGVAQVLFDLAMAPLADPEAAEHEGPTLYQHDHAHHHVVPEPPTKRVEIGSAIRKGTPNALRNDLYAWFMEGSWWRMFAVAIGSYLALNVFFGAFFLLDHEGVENLDGTSFLEAFSFSVQTMASIGYGVMAPSNSYAHILVTIEAMIGVLLVAVMTGLIFAKASRPRSSVLFSNVLVVNHHYGVPTLKFRVGNARGNELVEATMRVSVLIDEVSEEGKKMRRLHDLPLLRDNSPIFTLSWTVMHHIDEDSPLHGMTPEDVSERLFSIIATMTGHDSTYAQTTHARHLYHPEDIVFDRRFVDVISTVDDGRLMVDYTVFHDTLPDEPGEE
ncbi:MAG: low temperature requirement protein LtrA [Myxococcota bacterium]|jgi:low temperature requirement protein LtrA